MFIKLILICLSFFFISHSWPDTTYKSIELKVMPVELQKIFEDTFKTHQHRRSLVKSIGSEILGINMLFTDAFAMSRVAIKFDLEGNFELNKTYQFNGFNVIHLKISNYILAIMYLGLPPSTIESIIKMAISRNARSSRFSFFSARHTQTMMSAIRKLIKSILMIVFQPNLPLA